MLPIARPASRLVHARIGLRTTANLPRWQSLFAPALRHNLPSPPTPPGSLLFPLRRPAELLRLEGRSQTSLSDKRAILLLLLPELRCHNFELRRGSRIELDVDRVLLDSTHKRRHRYHHFFGPQLLQTQTRRPLPEIATKIYTALPPALSERLSHLMDTVQTRLLTASTTLNTLTGYSPIEAIKEQNTLLETRLAEAQALVRTARATYKTTNAKRATTQREVTTLLARKEMWSPTDLERFTQLYRQDHSLEQEVSAAAEALTDAEHAEQALGQQLNAGILKRYHEEQIWSDRIRRASTWGTWGLMGVNVLLFIVLQFVAEPWKRRRLVLGVVEEEKAVLEGVTAELAGLKAALAQREATDAAADAATAAAAAAAAAATTPATPVVMEEETLVAEPTEAAEAEAAAAVATAEATATGAAAAGEEALSAKLEEPAVQHEMEREVASALEALKQEVPTPKSWREFLTDPALPALLKAKLVDLYSERHIDLRMRDASILALEGAAAGATLAGGIALLLLRRT
ncbi:she9/mdm33 family protein [Colletotrichum higginsianum]|nr:she9/mdm33 family protein [Colletotrichum higginsianum]